MNTNDIVSLISSIGFPIVCCGAMFWFINKTFKDFTDKIQQHLDSLSSAINDNTDVTQKLVTTVELIAKIGRDNNG